MADMWGRMTPRVGRTWTASRLGALRRGVAPTPPDHLPCLHMAGTDFEGYKKGLPLPLQGHIHSHSFTIHPLSCEGDRVERLHLYISLGSV